MATTRKNKAERPLPALPERVGELGPDTPQTVELAGWLTAMQTLAMGGDERAAKALIAAYDKVPRLWERITMLQDNAERSWLDLMLPDSPDTKFPRAALRRELDRRRQEVAGEEASPLERVLAERVALCWIQATHADTQYAQRLATPGGITLKESEFLHRRCERASRQLLRAVQTLATVRKLLAPTIQVNVAEKQINVAG